MDKLDKTLLNEERSKILFQLEDWLEIPLIILGFCWLILIICELTVGLSPFLQAVSTTIWIIFLLDFFVKFCLAPQKIEFLKSNWITIIALLIPAFRIFKSLEVLRAFRGFYLLKVMTSIRHGMEILGMIFIRHGFGYILGLTFLVTVMGAAGMQALEDKFKTYGEALWWTAMIITTMGTDYWPKTPEGRVLCLCLAVYAFAVFGYITATLATFFITKDKIRYGKNERILEAIEELKSQVESLKTEKSKDNHMS